MLGAKKGLTFKINILISLRLLFFPFTRFSDQLINWATPTRFARSPSAGLWRSSTSPTSNRPSHPEPLRRGASWSCRLCRAPRSTDVMSNSPFSSDSPAERDQTIGRVELDITSCWAIVQQVSRGLPVSTARSRLPAFTSVVASSFQFSLRHHLGAKIRDRL
jgi:hypothetical protein